MNTRKLKTLRRKLYTQYIFSYVFNSAYDPGHGPIPSWHDVEKLLRYDRKKKKDPHTPLPQMCTLGGENLLVQLLDAYEDARPICDTAYKQSILKSSGWVCACGRINPSYTYSCVCGKNK